MTKEAADVKNHSLQVDKKWHDAVNGQNGTTLNAIIGEERTLVIKFGAEARKLLKLNDSTDDNIIAIRGVSADVDRASKEILRIVENAKNDEIDNSYSVEFDILREFVGKIVGAQGIGINRLRDQLGVRLDFQDEAEEKEREKDVKKKKSSAPPASKSKVKVSLVG